MAMVNSEVKSYHPDLDFYVKEFLNIAWNEKKYVEVKPHLLNPMLRVLETMHRPCFINLSFSATLTGLEPYYKIYPAIYGPNAKNPEKVLGIDYISNPFKV